MGKSLIRHKLPKLTQKEIEKLNSSVYNKRNNFELKFYTCPPKKQTNKKTWGPDSLTGEFY